MEVYAALNDYVKEADEINAPILPSVKLLLAEFVRYSISRFPYYYPPMLPKAIISEVAKTGEIDPDIWIPLEDLYDGWEKNGQVGQEVYGAGIGFGVVPRQYIKLENGSLVLFTDYPIANFRKAKNQATFKTLGAREMSCRIIVFKGKVSAHVQLEARLGATYSAVKPVGKHNRFVFDVNGDTRIRLTFRR